MMKRAILYLCCLLLLASCGKREERRIDMDNLSALKEGFLQQLRMSGAEEGPFRFDYHFRTIFFSHEVMSLFGELGVQDRMPHGWTYYEGKTFYLVNNQYKEISLQDLFPTAEQKEYLRQLCENSLKKWRISYFAGKDPLLTTLELSDVDTFFIDDTHLIIVFQPYRVGGWGDSPFIVKIHFEKLKGHWDESHPFHALLSKAISSRDFVLSQDVKKMYENVMEG